MLSIILSVNQIKDVRQSSVDMVNHFVSQPSCWSYCHSGGQKQLHCYKLESEIVVRQSNVDFINHMVSQSDYRCGTKQ